MSKYAVESEGTFAGTVTEPIYGWLGENKNGTKFIRVPVQITEGSESGKTITWYGYLTEKSRDKTVEALDHAFGTEWNWQNINFEGKKVEVVVEQDEYNGKISYKAKYLNNPDAVRNDEQSIEEAKIASARIAAELAIELPRLAELATELLRNSKPTANTPSKKASKIAEPDDDEIPF